MNVIVKADWMEAIEKLLTVDETHVLLSDWSRHRPNHMVRLNLSKLCDASLAKLAVYLEELANKGSRSARLSSTAVRQWIDIKRNPDEHQKVTRLENLEPILKQIIEKTEHGYLFQKTPDGNMLPWFVSMIEFTPPERYALSFVTMTLVAFNSEGQGKIRFIADDIRDRTVGQMFAEKALYLETPERMHRYETELEVFLKQNKQIGLQMTVTGKAKLVEGWYHASFRAIGKSGRPARMVVDIQKLEEDSENEVDSSFDEGLQEADMHSMSAPYWSDDEDKLWKVPIHPVLRMFDLEEHAFYRVHINQVKPYVYDTAVDRNLVLPAEAKDFIRLLIRHSKDSFQDIIKGKEGGTIVMLEGPPGVGKTLTAEVYAEVMERPLYRVHSSQIGITPETLEEELKKVLARAERWGAILLIDEGDVFLHERGTDIVQNAVVGVFLRLLEYYRGVLFTTTNRGTTIDDAIISRLTARFEYQLPSMDEQKELWRILGAQNGIELPDSQIDKIVSRLPGLSGRDIKNLLKLALVASQTEGAVTLELLVRVSRFRQTRAVAKGGKHAK
jgi:hypothetical protein